MKKFKLTTGVMDFPFTEISVKELGLETKISFSSIKSKAKEMGLR